MSVRSAIHDWWPIAAFLSFVLLMQALLTNSVVANGKHASDHLQSAEVIFPVAFFLAVIFWGAREARKHANARFFVACCACIALCGPDQPSLPPR